MSPKNKYDFSDFLTISAPEWKKKIREELNNPSEEDIRWKKDGLDLDAFYVRTDLKKLSYLEDFHSLYSLKIPRRWHNREQVQVNDMRSANSLALSLLEKGADSLEFDIRKADMKENDLRILLQGIQVDFFPVHFLTGPHALPLCSMIKGSGMADLKGSLRHEGLTQWMVNNAPAAFPSKDLADCMADMKEFPRYKILAIDAAIFNQWNLGVVKEVAYSLSLALECMDRLTNAGFGMTEVLPHFGFAYGIGKSFFPEIGKLRAHRFLWHKITESCTSRFDSFSTPLHGTVSAHLYSKDNPYQNILQNTSAAMAALTGGCDSLTIPPFDTLTKEDNEFSSRISRNVSIILKEESYFDKVVDPGAGSYYIETITDQVARKAWELIVDIEKHGGFISAWEKGLIK